MKRIPLLIAAMLLIIGALRADSYRDFTFADSDISFITPNKLSRNTKYIFEFMVYNGAPSPTDQAEKGIWISGVEIELPNLDYLLAEDTNQPLPPDCLHPGDYCERWEVSFDRNLNTIRWRNVSPAPDQYGDIREQDVQTFDFVATTDAIPGTLFLWTLIGDDGTIVSGKWTFSIYDSPETEDDSPTPTCCRPGDPCHLAWNGRCDCSTMIWDYPDCLAAETEDQTNIRERPEPDEGCGC